MKVILAIMLAITIGLMVSQRSIANHGTVHTMGDPSVIVITGGK